MATSNSTNFTETRDTIIQRALRICSAIGQGETPTTTQYTESAQALNDVVKKFETDGMQLWERYNFSLTPTASTATYAVGVGQTLNATAPLKVLQAYYRNTTTSADTPMMIITSREYDLYSNKTSTGTPSMLYYTPPGAGTGEMVGTVTLCVVPDSTFATNNIVHFIGQLPIQDFDASADNPDFPSYYFNALIWALAGELAWEYGVPLAERSMIMKKADAEHLIAISFDQEEGSLFIQPGPAYEWT